MTEASLLFLAALAGVALGAFFFGGLWWTVRRGMNSPRPALWFIGSLLLRTAAVVSGFYLIAQGDWKRLTACLTGFVAARFAATRLIQPTATRKESDAP